MDDQSDDQLAATIARWQALGAGAAPDAQMITAAPRDITTLLDEIERLRQYLAALTPPAKVGMERVAVCCERLRRYLVDPDNVIDYWAELDQYLLPVRGGTRSGIVIAFCPWCGSPLPVPPKDRDGTEAGEDAA